MIGLFDSGSGGLSVLSALRKIAPRADVAYFGDIAHAPYGVRSASELEELTHTGIATLTEMGATEIVAACNSVSPAVLAGAAGRAPIIEMSLPTADFLQSRAGQRMLLIATPATIHSGLYQHAIGSLVALDALPIAELGGAIEFGESDERISQIIKEAFASRSGKTYDALLLGCTHYPLVCDCIEKEATYFFGNIELIDPAQAVAKEALMRFDTQGVGKLQFGISKDSEAFRRRVADLFPNESYSIEIV